MASTYSPSLRLELMATGDQSGTWGDTTNTNLGTLLEQSITGYLSKAMANANQTLTNLNGASDEARNMVLNLTGALTAGRNVVVPTANKVYLVRNSTTGGFAVTVKTSAGTGVAVYPGQTRWVACDGTNVVDYDVPKFLDSQFLLADDADVTKLAAFQLSGLTTGTTRTYTMVDRSGTLLLSGGTLDTQFILQDNGNTTKQAQFNASGLPTATTRTYDFPYYSGTLGLVSDIRGQIYGLTLSNNVTDPTNDIDIAAGAAVDTTGAVSILLASGLTKRADAVWSAGTNQGGRFYTTLADGTIHIYLIRNPTTGVVDSGFSDNATNPTGGASYPAGFTQYRRIGSILRVSGAIRRFTQIGNDFFIDPISLSQDNPGTSAVILTIAGVPTGIEVEAIFSNSALFSAGTGNTAVLFTPLAVFDSTPLTNGAFSYVAWEATTTVFSGGGEFRVKTNTSGQIRYRFSNSNANTVNRFAFRGWMDPRS